MEYYSILKKGEILTHATTWMNLENIMLSEISQTQKVEYCMIPLIWSTYNSQIHKDRKQNGGWLPGVEGNGGGVGGSWGVSIKRVEFQVGKMKKF